MALPLLAALPSCQQESEAEARKIGEDAAAIQAEIDTLQSVEKIAAESQMKSESTKRELEETRECIESLEKKTERLQNKPHDLQASRS